MIRVPRCLVTVPARVLEHVRVISEAVYVTSLIRFHPYIWTAWTYTFLGQWISIYIVLCAVIHTNWYCMGSSISNEIIFYYSICVASSMDCRGWPEVECHLFSKWFEFEVFDEDLLGAGFVFLRRLELLLVESAREAEGKTEDWNYITKKGRRDLVRSVSYRSSFFKEPASSYH